MHYPIHKQKHSLPSFFTAMDLLEHLGNPTIPPETIILIYSRKVLAKVKKIISKKEIKGFYHSGDLIVCNNIGVLYVPGIGAPQTTTEVEELISLGTKKFIIVGTAGGLIKEGIFVCTKAIRDEGTSHHYLKPGKYVMPDLKLTEEIKQILKMNKIDFSESTTWTTDAPYRETKKEILQYASKGIATVEMEAAALFAVAKYREVQSAAIFSISDVMGKKWKPKFTDKQHKNDIAKIIKVLVQHYRGTKSNFIKTKNLTTLQLPLKG